MNRRHIPVEDFCKNPAMSAVRLSPDGKLISFLKRWCGHKNLFVKRGVNGSPERISSEQRRDVGSYFWKTDRYLIYQAGSDYLRLGLANGDVRHVLTGKAAGANIVDPLQGISEDELLIELPRANQNVTDVYRLDVSSDEGPMRMVAQHPDPEKFGIIQQWILNYTGNVCAAISVKGLNDLLLTREAPESPFKIVRVMDFRRSIEDQFYPFLFYTDDDKGIYAITRTHRRRDKAAVVVLSARTGREIRCVYHNRSADVASFGFSRQRMRVTHVFFHNSKPRIKVLDKDTRPIFKTLAKLPRDYIPQLVAHDAAEEKFIVIASNDRQPGRYYLLDGSVKTRHTLTFLGETAPWLDAKDLAPVSPIKFKARDGLTIHGYLTLPRGRRGKKLPLIVNVHGGPENRNYWYFDPLYGGEIQFLANRGCATLQVNFRGSIGYGRSFWTKGFRQRGRKMQDDVTDGVRWLIKRGIVDPKRIAIYGKSYGGYAALAGVTFPPNLYQAAIDFAGVSNWLTWLRDFPPSDPLFPQFCVKVGDPVKDRKWLEEVAPALHGDKVTKPIFIAHGVQDNDVLKSESDQMIAALGNKEVECMFKPDEGHIWQKEKNKIDFCRAMEAFLAKHLR